MPTATVNGTELYYETRGRGPSLLFIQGATGDGGTFDRVAGLLADEFTVVTYDRRGNSRSPRPPNWQATSMDEQADDAAALLRSLDLAPGAIFGTSGGGIILLNLLSRHPDVVRRAIVHEPPLVSLLPDAAELGTMLQTRTRAALARGGPRGAMEMFLRAEAGDENVERLDPELRTRMLGNAELFFSLELQAFVSYVPDLQSLRQVTVPIDVVAGRDHPAYYAHEAARQLAAGLGRKLHEIPDKHAPYFEDPQAFASALRPFLGPVSERTAGGRDDDAMLIDENRALVRRFMDEVWNQMNPEAVDRFVAPDMIDHSGRGSGREAVKRVVRLFASAFPDWFTTIEDLIAEGDKVVMRGTATGRHRGVFMGIPPTGKRITVPGIHIMRIAHNKIVEHWAQGDYLGMMQQLGVIAQPEFARTEK